jgi:hypothetical protein
MWLACFALTIGYLAMPVSAAPVLSGLVNFSTDGAGSASAGQIWNTLGSDGWFNLYVTQPNSGLGGAFLNAGNAAGTSISQILNPGTYQFYFFGEPGGDTGFAGLNLFFDGDDTNPGISVYGPTDHSPSPPFSTFAANSGPNTLTLDALSLVPGAGTLTYVSGDTTVTLMDYQWSTPEVYGVDRVQGYDDFPTGAPDFVGSITLEVSTAAVPEPTSMATLGLIACGMGVVSRIRSRKQRQGRHDGSMPVSL